MRQSGKTPDVASQLEATTRAVLEVDGFCEKAIAGFIWERRGVLGRLVRVEDAELSAFARQAQPSFA